MPSAARNTRAGGFEEDQWRGVGYYALKLVQWSLIGVGAVTVGGNVYDFTSHPQAYLRQWKLRVESLMEDAGARAPSSQSLRSRMHRLMKFAHWSMEIPHSVIWEVLRDSPRDLKMVVQGKRHLAQRALPRNSSPLPAASAPDSRITGSGSSVSGAKRPEPSWEDLEEFFRSLDEGGVTTKMEERGKAVSEWVHRTITNHPAVNEEFGKGWTYRQPQEHEAMLLRGSHHSNKKGDVPSSRRKPAPNAQWVWPVMIQGRGGKHGLLEVGFARNRTTDKWIPVALELQMLDVTRGKTIFSVNAPLPHGIKYINLRQKDAPVLSSKIEDGSVAAEEAASKIA